MKSDPPVFSPPAPNVDDLIARIEGDIGPLPLALKVFYQVVSSINLEGLNPHWQPVDGLYDMDPLEVCPLDETLIEDMTEDHRNFLSEEGEDRYRISIAPDCYALMLAQFGQRKSLHILRRGCCPCSYA